MSAPLFALAPLGADGWEPFPSAARVLEHAAAHPRPWNIDNGDGEGNDLDTSSPAGLWLMRVGECVGPVILTADAPLPGFKVLDGIACAVVSPVYQNGVGLVEGLRDTGATFLPCDAEGRPLTAPTERDYLAIIEEGTRERTELARQLANVTPFTALEALRAAPGWQATAPTIEEIDAHAEAFPYGAAAADDEVTDPDAPMVGALWAFDGANGVGLVELFRGRHGLPWVQYVDAALTNADAELCDFVADGTTTRWLRLTADAHPVTRAVSK